MFPSLIDGDGVTFPLLAVANHAAVNTDAQMSLWHLSSSVESQHHVIMLGFLFEALPHSPHGCCNGHGCPPCTGVAPISPPPPHTCSLLLFSLLFQNHHPRGGQSGPFHGTEVGLRRRGGTGLKAVSGSGVGTLGASRPPSTSQGWVLFPRPLSL